MAIRLVLVDDHPIVLQGLQQIERTLRPPGAVSRSEPHSKREARDTLTPREIEIVRMVSRGLRNRIIAKRLSISEGTVKVHLHNVYEKLGVDGRLELVLCAQQKRLT
jgi:DNA-binding NarL/FixJ family response regulator